MLNQIIIIACFATALMLCVYEVECQTTTTMPGSTMGTTTEDPAEKEKRDKEMADKLEKDVLDAHKDDPRDTLELARATLVDAISNYKGKRDIPALEILATADLAGGEERMHLIRLLEIIDKDMNGRFSPGEITEAYAAPMAYPDKAIELMHRLYDYNNDGFLSPWETLRHLLTLDGNNQNIHDKWAEALQVNKVKDSDSDGLINLTEFMMYMVWQINKGVEEKKKGSSG